MFPTLLYQAENAGSAKLNAELEVASLSLATDDIAGRKWCARHGYIGFTSYASLNDLPWRIPAFKRLTGLIDKHAMAFAKFLHWDLRGGHPVCDSLWVNVMPGGASHTSHIHTNSVISGTYYVTVPAGAGAIVFEDPRLAMFMAAPARRKSAPPDFRHHVSATPKPGMLLLWESWLRHEVALNRTETDRISVSFNYVIATK